MERTSAIIAGICIFAIVVPTAAAADTATNYYTPPKLIKRGSNSAAIEGPGTVMVKVLVNKDGTFKVQGIISSTNHGDDKAALEIAKTSTYRPARKGSKAQTAFYDFRLNFSGSGSSIDSDTSELGTIKRMIDAGNFSGAKTKVDAYLQAHPGEAGAELDLGLADSFLNDFEGAAAAFDKAGPVPANYRAVAAKSYAEAAVSFAKAKDVKSAVAAGKKAVDLAPGFGTYAALGYAEYAAEDYSATTTALEKARGLGASEKDLPLQQRALVDLNLAAAYIHAANIDSAQKVGAEAKQLDPSISKQVDIALSNYYGNQAHDLSTAKKYADAASMYEQGAVAVPSSAAAMYGQAALASLFGDHPDNARAKTDADKAIALDPNNAVALYAAGVSLANQSKSKDALDFLKRADDAAKKAGNADLSIQIELAIKRVSGTK